MKRGRPSIPAKHRRVAVGLSLLPQTILVLAALARKERTTKGRIVDRLVKERP